MILNPKAWWTYLRSSGDNFHIVVPGRIFRSATPSPENLERWYVKYGIRTWIDLRQAADWDGDARVASDKHRNFQAQIAKCDELGIDRVWVPISDRTPTSDFDIDRVLGVLRNRAKDGILIACAGGRHRAGEMIALYGQRVLGWGKDQVKKSLKQGGFYSSGHRDFAKRLEQLLGFTLALLLLVVPALGQAHPFIQPDLTTPTRKESLQVQKFDRSYFLPFGLAVASSVTDWHSTYGGLNRGGREANPIFRSDQGRAVRWAANVAATAGFLGYTAWLEQTGHRKIARVLLYTLTALRVVASIHNYRIRR